MRKSLAIVVTLASVAAFACSSQKPNPPITPTVSTDAGADTGPVVVADAGAPVDAGAVAVVPDAGATTTVGSPAEALVDNAIDLAMTAAATKAAPKMDKDGAPSHATLAEGGHFSMMINLAPNRCYTIIAHSPTGAVSQLDLKLYGPPFFNVEAGKSATSDKNTPVIGKGAQALCPIIPLQVPYKVDVAATKGAGRIGVQVYARNK
jgi:hypothetical protein